MLHLTNAFSLNMVAPESFPHTLHSSKIALELAYDMIRMLAPVSGVVCHISTPEILTLINENCLTQFQPQRAAIQLHIGDTVLVAQYRLTLTFTAISLGDVT